MTYPHGDHLGSVSVVTDASGNLAPNGKQEFDPWGNAALRALSLYQAGVLQLLRDTAPIDALMEPCSR